MSDSVRTVSSCEAETIALAGKFARLLHPGDTVGLNGDLGSGKTIFVRGVCQGLGYSGSITSPTFTLMHSYDGSPPIYHFDCFRLRRAQEMIATGFDDLISLKKGILLVEWADIIREYFDDWDFQISMHFSPEDENSRTIEIAARDNRRAKNLARSTLR